MQGGTAPEDLARLVERDLPATGTVGPRGAVKLARSCSEEVDQVGCRMKRVGDDRAVCECERCSDLSVDFGEQDGLRWRR
jgi:hypothetical protein